MFNHVIREVLQGRVAADDESKSVSEGNTANFGPTADCVSPEHAQKSTHGVIYWRNDRDDTRHGDSHSGIPHRGGFDLASMLSARVLPLPDFAGTLFAFHSVLATLIPYHATSDYFLL